MRNEYAMTAGLLAISLMQPYEAYSPRKVGNSPNDHGPVIDSTPQSKRAKRRAKSAEKRNMKGK